MTILLICISLPLLMYLVAEFNIKENFTKWFKVPVSTGKIGLEVATHLLEKYELKHIKIAITDGQLTDHYDSENRRIALSKEVYYGNSVAAIAVLAHEIGHALQDKANYTLYSYTMKLKPLAVLFGSITPITLIFGLLVWPWLIGITIFAIILVILVQILVLLVEWDASKRAKEILLENGLVKRQELIGVNQTLTAAGFTYVAAIFRWNY